jgi:CPA2 family monovalent cation:H+ antiporter-2
LLAVGSLVNPAGISRAAGWIVPVIGLVLIVKAGSIFGVGRMLRQPGVSPSQLGVGLGQVGEFSFVLASVGLDEHVLGPAAYTAIISGVVLTIEISTIGVRIAPARTSRRVR